MWSGDHAGGRGRSARGAGGPRWGPLVGNCNYRISDCNYRPKLQKL
jgi:hypothetical protein